MASQTEKAKAKLSILASNLDDLETQLEPLFVQTLPESILGLEPIQQAKLQTVLPYLVYDLVFSASHYIFNDACLDQNDFSILEIQRD